MNVDPARYLSSDPELAAAIGRIGPCGLRRDDGQELYNALLRAIASQQLHGAAARKVFGRVCALGAEQNEAGPPPTPKRFPELKDEVLRGCGLSAAKMAAMRGVAQARLVGIVPSRDAASELSDEALIARLTILHGIGRWTVEMILIFTLDRSDVMPVAISECVQAGSGLRAWKRPLRQRP